MKPLTLLTLLLFICLLALLFLAPAGHAAEIPRKCLQYRSQLIREARFVWGMSAPVATFAAQLHAESGCNPRAISPVGAQGLSQAMPGTARDMGSRYADLREVDTFNPAWSIRFLVRYDHEIWIGMKGKNDCQRMAKALAGYNAGPGWIHRMEAAARNMGKDFLVWFGVVEDMEVGRTAAASAENRAYPRRILLTLEPLYVHALFGRGSAEGNACA